jgi:hypothetical protein
LDSPATLTKPDRTSPPAEQKAQRGQKQRVQQVAIVPVADGWRVAGLEARPVSYALTLEEAAASVPDNANVTLSLPVSAVLFERMRLPSTDPAELSGMVLLQLEKSLPYAIDELTSGFDIITREENESELIVVVVNNEQLDGLCEPLRNRAKLPGQVAIFAIQIAARFPDEELLALIYRELDSTILAIAKHGKLVAAHSIPSTNQSEFIAEFPRTLLSAELEGTPVNFTKAIVERGIAGWIPAIKEHLDLVPIDAVELDPPLDAGPVNLVPEGWTTERRKLAQNAKIRDWLALAGIIYLCLLLAAAASIIWIQHQVSVINAKVVQATPAVDAITSQTGRWLALAPALDPNHYSVELLQQITKSIPNPDLHVTIFDQEKPGEFMIEGEAPDASGAIQYMDSLKKNPDLAAYHFTSTAPEILPNEHAHFRIMVSQ